MLYVILAAITAFIHGFFVFSLFIGVFFVLFDKLKKWPVIEKTYLTFAILMVASFILTGKCYLTDIEQRLWLKVNSPFGYRGGFISHYLAKINITVPDDIVYWSLVIVLILGLGTYLIRYIIKYFTKNRPASGFKNHK